MTDTDKASELAAYFKALSDPNRLRVLAAIIGAGKAGITAAGVQVKLGTIAQPTVSHHVAVLVGAGLVTSTRNGRHVDLRANRATISRTATDVRWFLGLTAGPTVIDKRAS